MAKEHYFRELAHLMEKSGTDSFEALISSEHTRHASIVGGLLRDEILPIDVLLELEEKLRAGTMTKSDWDKLFGHLRVWDSDFNKNLYSLGVDDNTKAEEHGFDRTISGHEALAEFERMKRKDASLWAQGRYINDNPNAQKEHPLVGTGARREVPRISLEWFPVFFVGGVGVPAVGLDSLGSRFDPSCRFLLQVQD